MVQILLQITQLQFKNQKINWPLMICLVQFLLKPNQLLLSKLNLLVSNHNPICLQTSVALLKSTLPRKSILYSKTKLQLLLLQLLKLLPHKNNKVRSLLTPSILGYLVQNFRILLNQTILKNKWVLMIYFDIIIVFRKYDFNI